MYDPAEPKRRRRNKCRKIAKNFRRWLVEGNDNPRMEALIGCSRQHAIGHFLADNGRTFTAGCGLTIDHVVPLDAAQDDAEGLMLWHWTNLRLLTKAENSAKSNALPAYESLHPESPRAIKEMWLRARNREKALAALERAQPKINF